MLRRFLSAFGCRASMWGAGSGLVDQVIGRGRGRGKVNE